MDSIIAHALRCPSCSAALERLSVALEHKRPGYEQRADAAVDEILECGRVFPPRKHRTRGRHE